MVVRANTSTVDMAISAVPPPFMAAHFEHFLEERKRGREGG